MEKLKDILYDKNDILIAFLIVAVAALVIVLRVNAIMDYPQLLIAQAKENAAQADAENQSGDSADTGVSSQSGESSDYEMPNLAGADSDNASEGKSTDTEKKAATSGKNASSAKSEQYSVYINYGETLYTVGEKFAGIGLFDSADDFVKMVERKGVATKIQAGNFIIPADATEEEVIECLVK
ncbi:MAG: hypothetical protein K6F52_00485 [Clostridia bacterium]|nr:hypothetical protein [Clostridia bacterium]